MWGKREDKRTERWRKGDVLSVGKRSRKNGVSTAKESLKKRKDEMLEIWGKRTYLKSKCKVGERKEKLEKGCGIRGGRKN